LERFKGTGRRLILVTGRELADVKEAFPRLEIFDRVVAENGAVVYDPANGKEAVIGAGPPPAFVERLRQLNVTPLSVGRSIVATWSRIRRQCSRRSGSSPPWSACENAPKRNPSDKAAAALQVFLPSAPREEGKRHVDVAR
jgi:haloacid dehalogenase-like hydrolase